MSDVGDYMYINFLQQQIFSFFPIESTIQLGSANITIKIQALLIVNMNSKYHH